MYSSVQPSFPTGMWESILRLLPLPDYVWVTLYGFNHWSVLKTAEYIVGDSVSFHSLGYLECRLKNFTVDTLVSIYKAKNSPEKETLRKGSDRGLPNISISKVSWENITLTRTKLTINLTSGIEPPFLKPLKDLFKGSSNPLILVYKG